MKGRGRKNAWVCKLSGREPCCQLACQPNVIGAGTQATSVVQVRVWEQQEQAPVQGLASAQEAAEELALAQEVESELLWRQPLWPQLASGQRLP